MRIDDEKLNALIEICSGMPRDEDIRDDMLNALLDLRDARSGRLLAWREKLARWWQT